MAKAHQTPPLSLDSSLRVEPSLLKDQTTELLRNQIVRGLIRPGTRLVERELAELLGVSRVPVRDALNELQKEGLVDNKPSGRFVIELSERDIHELYQTRLALEKLAVELATQNTSRENAAALIAKQQEMEEAFKRKDVQMYVQSDVDTHRLIWQQANNRHLLKTLNAMVGPIFMFVASNAEQYDWSATIHLHEDLVTCINSGNVERAMRSIEAHMSSAITRSLHIINPSQPGSDGTTKTDR